MEKKEYVKKCSLKGTIGKKRWHITYKRWDQLMIYASDGKWIIDNNPLKLHEADSYQPGELFIYGQL